MNSPILITGGTQRLGLAIAEHLIAKGESIIVTYRKDKPAVDHLKNLGATLIKCDFEHDNAVTDLIKNVLDLTPSLRAIIHNASDWDAETNDTADVNVLDKMMRIHVSVPYQMNWALQELLISSQGFTDIIHMTDYVQDVGSAKHIAYSASKAALHNLTLSFAKKLAPHVKVNSIAPALVMFNDDDNAEYRRKAQKKSLLEKVPGPHEAVKAVDFLLSSDYVTGQTMHLNGGRHLK